MRVPAECADRCDRSSRDRRPARPSLARAVLHACDSSMRVGSRDRSAYRECAPRAGPPAASARVSGPWLGVRRTEPGVRAWVLVALLLRSRDQWAGLLSEMPDRVAEDLLGREAAGAQLVYPPPHL